MAEFLFYAGLAGRFFAVAIGVVVALGVITWLKER